MRKLIAVASEDSVKVAADLMRKHDLSQLPVIKDGTQVGSISDITLMRGLANKDFSPQQKLKDAMEEPLPTVDVHDKIKPIILSQREECVLGHG